MNKKIILTETQYDKLTKFINETEFNKIVKNVVKIGDIIRIEYKNSVSNFKVIDNVNGQIQMDNIDSGSANINYRYFISTTSLNGDDLEIRRVHKVKEKEKLKDIKSWTKLEVKDVKNIEVLRNDSVIDTVDTPRPSDSKLQTAKEKGLKGTPITDEFRTKVEEIIFIFLNQVKEGNGVSLNMFNKEVINLCCVGQGGNNFSFTLDSHAKKDDLKNWNTFNLELKGDIDKEDEDLYELNKNVIQTSDGGETFNMVFKGVSGNQTKDIMIKNIIDLLPTKTCTSEEDTKFKPETSIDTKDADVKEMMKVILDDPLMKKAFYRQPTLWNLLVSAIKGENPKGTGIGPAMNIISKYGTAKYKKALGPAGSNFKVNKPAKFEVLNKEIFINPTGNPYDILRLNTNSEYDATVNEYKLGDDHLTLTNKKLGFKIVILRPSKEALDVFEVNIIKIVKGKKTGEIKEYPKAAFIKFKNERGSGYSREELKNKF